MSKSSFESVGDVQQPHAPKGQVANPALPKNSTQFRVKHNTLTFTRSLG